MRILYVHQYFCTRRGRTGTRSLEQARAMRSAGHEVVMMTSPVQLLDEAMPAGRGRIRRGRLEGLDLVVLNVPYSQQMSYARRVGSFLRFMLAACWVVLTEPRIDLVYATSTPLTVGIPALAAKLLRGVPYFFEVRDLWPDIPVALGIVRSRWLSAALKAVERLIYAHARLIVAVNAGVARAVGRSSRWRRPIIVVPNACDTDLFDPSRDGSTFRRAHGLAGKVLCVHTGAMGPVNGLDAVLDLAAATRGDERLRYVLIGEGNQKERLQRRVADERLDNVLILDSVPKDELADVLATADIGLMTVAPIPILELNCANKFFDYLASGLPVVLNYGGWQAEVLAEHGCGLSASQGDQGAFNAAVLRLAGDEALRRRMAANARALAETALNRRTVVRPLLEELARLGSAH